MVTIVGEAFLSVSLELLLKKIVSGEFVDFFRSTKLDVELLEKLKITLLSLQAVLLDAEEKQITNSAVNEWLSMLRDAVFEADDLFDEINTEALRRKVEAEYQSGTAKVMKKLSSRFKRFNKKINSKLQKLYERLECLRKQKLGLKEGVSSSVWKVTPTSSVMVDESAIYGRDNDRKKLKEFLLSEDASDGGSKIGVVSIVGMGGLGKTTLAKLLYNDHEVKKKFEVRGWTHVSKGFDVFTLTKSLLESVTLETNIVKFLFSDLESKGKFEGRGRAHVSKDLDVVNDTKILLESGMTETTTASDLNKLQVQLQQSLRNKKYLLVLDDIWDGTYVDWNSLNDIFNVGKMGSKIIITTRDERVTLPMQASLYVHHLRSLEAEDCDSLLARHAFVGSNYQQRSNLEEIGREIAKKCGGLPLAAVALGGLLRIKLSQDYWNDVLNSSIWELTATEVQPALLLSYRYLPTTLKGCFAYCSIFPKNSIFDKKKVVQLWIAEGLVPQPKNEKRWEKVAEEYFDELVSRSLIRPHSIDGKEVSFEMHDLINDLATLVSSPYCIRLDKQTANERVRHLSYNRETYESYDKFDKLHGFKGLRTFLSLPLQESDDYCHLKSMELVFDTLITMNQLHVLSVSNYYDMKKLPKSIGKLIHLRYLNLSGTRIESLPSETCNLYNLQTLLLSGCNRLTKLPKDMGKLVNLRHLNIRGTRLKKMPVQISRLENLQTLSDFVVSNKDVGLKIVDLGKYPHLQGNLSISQLQNVTHPNHASQANLDMKEQIYELELHWSDDSPSNSQIQSVVLEHLRPSINLKSLTIDGYSGNTFPTWLGGSLFSNMVCMRISYCENCTELPPLGQLGNLKELFIGRMMSLKCVGTEFYGSGSSPSFQSFPNLETLEFDTMSKWEEWKLIGGTTTEFPRLLRLSLIQCPKLQGNIPLGQLVSLKELKIEGMESVKTIGSEFYGSSSSPLFQPFPSLEILSFKDMKEWEEWELTGGTSTGFPRLTHLSLDNIPSLTSFPKEGLPKTLQSLKIENCENLDFLPDESLLSYKSLEDLEISSSCNSMTSFTLCSLPVLKRLEIEGCKNLKSISIAENTSLLFLRSISVSWCDELESFSLGGLSIPSLTEFDVLFCKKLRSLPESIKIQASLQTMRIVQLPNLQSFSVEDLPTSLRTLSVGVDKVEGILEKTNWERLTSLSELTLWGDEIVNVVMKSEVPMLPTSLVELQIWNLSEIESLDGKWLQHLTSLQTLWISYAPKLKSLPGEGNLPSSLKQLEIRRCPLLEARLEKKQGKEWRKIAHIPKIYINYERIIQ